MHFNLVDRVLERESERIVTIKHVSAAEEYLQDHFPTFPVLPGVLMLEAMVQAGRELAGERVVLGRVRALKFGKFVKPGGTLRVEVVILKREEGGVLEMRGEARLLEAGGIEAGVAAAGKFTLRPVRLAGR